jgi:hypothetical protein
MLQEYLTLFKPHIISLNEIKLDKAEANKFLRFKKVTLVYLDVENIMAVLDEA